MTALFRPVIDNSIGWNPDKLRGSACSMPNIEQGLGNIISLDRSIMDSLVWTKQEIFLATSRPRAENLTIHNGEGIKSRISG